jgi:Tol biopolymer transport system component
VAVSFEPNGNRIVFTDAGRPETRLRIAKADGSNERILIRAHADRRSFATWKSNPLAWTPDGRAIAAAFTEKNESGLRSGVILVNPSDGSEQALIVPHFAYIENVTWLNAENVAFIAYEDDWSNQIWLFSRRNGETRQLTNGLANYKWLTSADGTLLAVETRATTSLHTADFDENTHALQTEEIYRESGYISNVAWSKDGTVLYSSRVTGKPEILRIDKDGANASQITSDARINFGLAVSPSDGSIIFCSHRGGKYAIWTADASGKNMRALTEGSDHITPDVSADGKIVFQSLSEQIWRLSPTDEKPVHLLRGLKPVLSPDGRQTAFFMMDEGKWLIGLMSTDSGELLKKIDLPTIVNQRRIRWHPNGKFLTMIFNVGDNLKLLLLPTDGGSPRIIEGLGKGDVNSFSWSRDGKQLLYSLTDEIQDVVLISNVE